MVGVEGGEGFGDGVLFAVFAFGVDLVDALDIAIQVGVEAW